MSHITDLDAIEGRLLEGLRSKLRIRARDLARGMKKAGRLLPRDAHRAAGKIVTAKHDATHPKLSRMLDFEALEAAEAVVQRHLDKIDPKERRKDAWLSFAGTQALNFIGIAALVLGLLAWRGFL